MLDHVFLSVSDIERSIAFYAQALAPLGIADRVDYDGKDGPPGHPDLKGFGCKGRFFFWLIAAAILAETDRCLITSRTLPQSRI